MKQKNTSIITAARATNLPESAPALAPNHPAQASGNDQNPAQTTLAGQTGNPSSSVSHRLTQYYAFRSTMYCKVPVQYRIFVMQADQKEKKQNQVNQISQNYKT